MNGDAGDSSQGVPQGLPALASPAFGLIDHKEEEKKDKIWDIRNPLWQCRASTMQKGFDR